MLGAEQRQSMERAGWRRGGAEDGLKLEEGRVTWRVLLVRGEGNNDEISPEISPIHLVSIIELEEGRGRGGGSEF